MTDRRQHPRRDVSEQDQAAYERYEDEVRAYVRRELEKRGR